MDSPSTAIQKLPLLLPALLAGSVFAGLSLGVVLTRYLNPIASPQLEAVSAPLNMASKQPSTQLTKQPGSVAAVAVVVDPALHYLNASASMAHDSKQLIGFIQGVRIERPEWDWSRAEIKANYAPMKRVFGVNKEAPVLAAAQPSTQPTIQTTTQPTVHPEAKIAAKTAAKTPAQAIARLKTVEAAPISQPKATAGKSKGRLVVALDPGHGGTDPGSEAHNGLVEKELTLDMAKRVELFLSEIDNVDVIMTRSTDRGMSRQSRVNKIQAVDADVVVSLHFNHLPQTDVNLVESFYADRHNVIESLEKQNRSPSSVNLDFTSASKDLAGILHKKVFNEVASVNENVTDAGVKNDTLFVLTRSFTPGVLLELTCISNPAEAERLATEEYRNQLAASIADGLRDYLMTHHSDQFAEMLAKLDSSTKVGQKL